MFSPIPDYSSPPGKMYSCSRCHKHITDRTVSMCDDRYWHQSCLTCYMCGHAPSPISGESLYAFRGTLICKSDYMRINSVCKSCSQPIVQSDLVIKTKNLGLLHDKCVFCRNCSSKLHPGDRYCVTTDHSLVCQKCMSTNGKNANNQASTSAPTTPSIKMEMDQNTYGQVNGQMFQRQSSHPPMYSQPNQQSFKMENGMTNDMNNGYSNGNMYNTAYMNGPQQAPQPPPPTSVPQSTPTTSTTGTGPTPGRRGRKKQNQNNNNNNQNNNTTNNRNSNNVNQANVKYEM